MENSFVPHLKHISIIIIAIVVVFFSLSGVFSTRNIDNLAYIVALGSLKENVYIFTFLFYNSGFISSSTAIQFISS